MINAAKRTDANKMEFEDMFYNGKQNILMYCCGKSYKMLALSDYERYEYFVPLFIDIFSHAFCLEYIACNKIQLKQLASYLCLYDSRGN